jgi:plastocyanin
MRSARSSFVVFVALASLLGTVPARAATYTVSMRDDPQRFSPAARTVAQASTITWTNVSESRHYTRQATSLFASWNRALDPGQSWSLRIAFAGMYAYYCTPHGTPTSGMHGTISVPERADPRSGSRSTVFHIIMASSGAPSGWTYDVQRRKGSGAWTSWRSGLTHATTTFAAGSMGAGTYYFRSRLHRTSNNAVSGYSPSVSIAVS